MEKQPEKALSPDWFLKGVLSKAGEIVDRFTGRNWQPTSSLATSELIERMKRLLDSEAREIGGCGKVVPHNITLKTQWDKFSTDSDASVEKLRQELHTAAIDHINDCRYYTYAPIAIEIKPDYFTDGIKLLAGFEKFDPESAEGELNVSLPEINVPVKQQEPVSISNDTQVFLEYSLDGENTVKGLTFKGGERKSIGRTKENDLCIDETSVSKMHAVLAFNSGNKLVVADTGSTNGTFINGERLAYAKGFELKNGDTLTIGSVDLIVRFTPEIKEEELASLESNNGSGIAHVESASDSEPLQQPENSSAFYSVPDLDPASDEDKA